MAERTLESVINRDSPFGPIKSEDLDSNGELELFKKLYSPGTEIHNRMQNLKPNCLLGRKGAGKTAFLMGMLIQEGSTVIQLKQSSLFAGMENVTRAFRANDAALNAELMADIWDACIYHVLALRIADDGFEATDPHDAKQVLWTYVMSLEAASGLTPEISTSERSNRIATWFLNSLQNFIEESETRGAGSEFLAGLIQDDVGFDEMKSACRHILNSREDQTVVLVDTLEDYGDNFTNLAAVSKGLLHHLATHDVATSGYRLFVCLPSEVSGLLRMISANPSKSLERSMHIQWTSRELVRLAAQRFSLYLSLHDQNRYRVAQIGSLTRVPFDEARRILESMLPETIVNGLGTSEPALLYIVRHTQLLPRQLIQFLNSIWRENRDLGGSDYEISAAAIRKGVQSAEPALVQDILSAYTAQHPLADEVCRKVIPQLTLKHDVETARKAIRDSKAHKLLSGEIDDALMLLKDIGAIGRHGTSTELYHEAHFSFTFQNMAALQRDEVACIHPAFAQIYQCVEVRSGKTDADTKPVYPYGANYIEAP